MIMMLLLVIMVVIVINLYNKGYKMKCVFVWFRIFILSWLFKFLFFKYDLIKFVKDVILVSIKLNIVNY